MKDDNGDGSLLIGMLNCIAFYLAIYVVYLVATAVKHAL